jgi:colanic acid/amylovoran biosynthesis protein
MKILLINQPTNNRGDEAAHRSLMRALNKKLPNAEITVLFFNANPDSVRQMQVTSSMNRYINIPHRPRFVQFIRRWSLCMRLPKLSFLDPVNRTGAKYIYEADLVVCAPGGICMGGFQDWSHIYWLSVAKVYGKRIAYYSRSFGPFPTKNFWNRRFKDISYGLLRYFSFLSIRDEKTEILAKQIGINYISSIDTAFLDVPEAVLPIEIKSKINESDYIVFVPNSLTWHSFFKNHDPEIIKKVYLYFLDIIFEKFPSFKVLMLPQLFNDVIRSDKLYFEKLASEYNDSRIVVIDDSYSSDIQQKIISNAKLVIGARYHSIVFAVNNNVPFISLSYEHKMEGMLSKLGYEDCMINLTEFLKNLTDIHAVGDLFGNLLENYKKSVDQKNNQLANEIAKKCLDDFLVWTSK